MERRRRWRPSRTPIRLATRAITSLPRLVPPAITTTALAASRAAITAGGRGRAGEQREVLAVGVVHGAHAVRRQHLAEVGRGRTDGDRVDGHPVAGGGQAAREGHGLERDLVDALGTGLDVDDDHRADPQLLEQVDDGGGGLGPLAEGQRAARHGLGQASAALGRCPPRGADGSRVSTSTFLAFIRPVIGRVARLHPALQHADHRRQRDLVGLGAQRSVAGAVRTRPPSGASRTSTVLHAGHDRAPELVGEPDRHLEVAGVGGVVAEQDQVVGTAGCLVVATTAASSWATSAGPSVAGSASTSVAAVQPTPRAERSCSTASAAPTVTTVAAPLGRRSRPARRSPPRTGRGRWW